MLQKEEEAGECEWNLFCDGAVSRAERGSHGGGGDEADLGKGGGDEEQHEEKLEAVGAGRAQAKRGEPVLPARGGGREQLVARQPGGDSSGRRDEAPQKGAHGHGCPPLLFPFPAVDGLRHSQPVNAIYLIHCFACLLRAEDTLTLVGSK
jgi:hypothetical protein